MADWMPCAEGFIVADIIRWHEGVWDRRGPKAARARKIGDREVTAEVIDGPDEQGFVLLLVRYCVLAKDTAVGMIQPGEQMKRKVNTIQRGKPERMAWSDETARMGVMGSRFMRQNTVSHAPSGAREN